MVCYKIHIQTYQKYKHLFIIQINITIEQIHKSPMPTNSVTVKQGGPWKNSL